MSLLNHTHMPENFQEGQFAKLVSGLWVGVIAVLNVLFPQHVRFCNRDYRIVWLDVSRSVGGFERVGTTRTTLRLAEEILRIFPTGMSVGFLSYSTLGRLQDASAWARSNLDLRGVSVASGSPSFQKGDIFLGLDLSLPPKNLRPSSVKMLVESGISVAFIVYDTLPLDFPGLFPPGKRGVFGRWLIGVSQASHLLCISDQTRRQLEHWIRQYDLPKPPNVSTFELGSDLLSGQSENVGGSGRLRADPLVLMVGTVEPRKDYFSALKAFEILWRSGKNFSVLIVGKKGWRCRRDLLEIQRLSRKYDLNWFPRASDNDLVRFYEEAFLLLANSHGEGFGLPIVEAQSRGTQVLAQNLEVFREIAGPGTRFLGSREPESISREIHRLLDQYQPSRRLPAFRRTKTWGQSAAQVLARVGL